MYLLFLRFSLLPFLLGLLFYNSDKRIPKDDSVVQDDVQLTEPLTPEEAQKRFKLPEGFKIELYASEPEIGKPMNIAFDEKGRLWVTESQEYPFAASLGKGKDRMMILEDRDGDGRAEIKTVFADTLNIPIGILPYQSGAIAFSIPNIYQFVDIQKNPKGKSGVLVGPFGHKDTHGMVNNLMRGYDGWVYVCHGFSNVSNPFGTDGSQLSLSSGNTFRFKTDGTQLQQTTYGRVNPFGQTLDEWGYLYSIDCHTSPLYQLIEGGDYPHFGKIEKGIGFAPVMKPHETEATAISGIAYYSDDQFPQAFQKNFFVGDVVKSRIYRYSSHFKGASPVAKLEEDFLTTDDPWFRPVDVKLGPDGAIYIADFYNRIIGHYEVPLDHPGRDRMRGRIWRISYEGKHPKNIQKRKKTDWTKASFSALWEGLNTPNLELRMQLINALSDRLGQAAVAPLKKKFAKNQLTNSQYVSGLWTLYRLNALEESLLTAALVHADPLVRTHALRIIKSGNTFNLDVLAISRQALQDPVSHVQRVAVSILGGLKDPKVMPELLNFAVKVAPQDDHLVYEVRLAIRELLKNEQVVSFVKTSTWDTSKANLLAQSYLGIDGPDAALYLKHQVQKGNPTPAQILKYTSHITRFLPEPQLAAFVQSLENRTSTDPVQAMGWFKEAMNGLEQRGFSQDVMWSWGKRLSTLVLRNSSQYENTSPALVISAWKLAGTFQFKEWANQGLENFEKHTNVNLKQAVAAYLLETADLNGIKHIFNHLNASQVSLSDKKKLLEIIGAYNSSVVLQEMEQLASIDPEIQIEVLSTLAASKEGKDVLLRKVKRGQILAKNLLNPTVNERILINMSTEQKLEYDYLIQNIAQNDTEKDALIAARLAAFEPTSVLSTGKVVFKTHCSPCHQVHQDEGGLIGPQLNSVGNWGKTALAEKVLDPNRNISAAFRMYTIRTTDGKIHSGLFRRDLGDVIYYADASGQEFPIRKADIVERQISNFTLMPNHFAQVLSQHDFNNLLSYLLELK